MKKVILGFTSFFLVFSYAHAISSCTDLSVNISRYQESSSVLAFQKFLFAKGFLKVAPNGYFGAQTFAASKLYQQSLGLSVVGNVGPLTRAAIKKETCTNTSSSPSVVKITPENSTSTLALGQGSFQALTTPSPYPSTPSGMRNTKRREDITTILKGLYARYVDSRGVHATVVSDTPVELCVNFKPLESEFSSTTNDGGILVTKDSPCSKYVDISYLVPAFLATVPHDPSVGVTDNLTGYTITRSAYNDVTLQAKNAEDGTLIKVTCNFNGFCKEIKYLTALEYKKPIVTSLSRGIFFRDVTTATPLTISGSYFTKTNTVKIVDILTQKERILGTFASTEISSTTSTISVDGNVFAQLYPCAYGNCYEKIPLGDYMLTVTNEGGVSNAYRVNLKGITTSTTPTHDSTSVIPKSKNVKIATFVLSSTYPLSFKSLTLTGSSTSVSLPSKLSNFVLKDALDGTTYNGGGGTFGFSNVTLYENQSKIYDLYVDVDEVELGNYGLLTYGGSFVLGDDAKGFQMEIPVKPFSFTVSY